VRRFVLPSLGVAILLAGSLALVSSAAYASPSATGSQTLAVQAGTLFVSSTTPANITAPVDGSGSGSLPTALWGDTTGTGDGWQGSIAASNFVYTGQWTPTGSAPALGSSSSASYTGSADGDTYTVSVTGVSGSTVSFSYSSQNGATGTGTATVGIAANVGTNGLTITFSSSATYSTGDEYQIQVGAQNKNALTLADGTSSGSIAPYQNTTSTPPTFVNPTAAVTGGGSTYGTSVSLLSAPVSAGMGEYMVTPAATVNTDMDSWAATYTGQMQYSISSGPAALATESIKITTTSLPTGETNAAYSYQLSATGGSGSYQWSATNLPTGLALSSSGLLSGTPEYGLNNGTVDVTVRDSQGDTVSASLPLTINISASQEETDNWSGYEANGSDFTSVSGEFTVASLASSQPSACNTADACSVAQWVGIDGSTSTGGPSIIQAGTAWNATGNGGYELYPWVESYPNSSQVITGMSVSAGNTIYVSISQTSPGQWAVEFKNMTTGEAANLSESFYGEGNSAEWITEAPTEADGQIATLSPYSGANYFKLAATGNINRYRIIDMAQGGQIVSEVTSLSSSGFSTSYE